MKDVFAFVDTRPLRDAAFRRFWIGGTLSGLGSQMSVVAVLAQVWDLAGDPIAVGAIGLAQAAPMIVLGLAGGQLADTLDRRTLVVITTAGQTIAATLLAIQAIAGVTSLGLVLGLVALQSGCGGLGAPARRTFVSRLLPVDQVSAGVTLSHLSFQGAMLVGPALAGSVTAVWGVAVCYLIDAATYLVAFYSVLRLPPMPHADGGTRPKLGALWAGWRFIGSRPVLRGAFVSDLLATVLAMPVALFPMINEERFEGSPNTLGLFLSAIALGGIAAGAAAGTVTRRGRPGAVMLAACAVWGASLIGFGLGRDLWLVLACLVVAGAADTIAVVTRGTIVQVATPDPLRGRVSAVEHVLGVSGPDLGNFRAGLVASVSSASVAAVVGGAVCLAGVVAMAVTNRSLRRFDIPVSSEVAGARAPSSNSEKGRET